ncbi:MAG TPA: hypothetical protein VMA83_10460 [Solirubrobacteraceae bacterium]|nr:hypothetical protein [Solirubrobacteraceae bacterium]
MTSSRATHGLQAHSIYQNDDGAIVLGVMLLGLVIAGSSLLALLGTITTPSYSATGGKALFTVVECGELMLGLGITLRVDLARQLYVVLTSIGIVLGVVAIVVALASGSNLSSAAAKGVTTASNQTVVAANLRSQIAADEQSTALSSPQRETRVNALRSELARTEAGTPGAASSQGMTEFALTSFLLSIFALFFFTRFRVKRVFA